MSAARPDTWMPLYVADYLADTGHLSTRQHGAYLLLIMHYWRTGRPLPTRVGHLFRICRLTEAEWAEDGGAVMEFFDLKDGGYVHGRIEKELQAAQQFIEKKAAAGKASAQARAQRTANTPSTPVQTPVPTGDTTNGQLEAKTSPSPSPIADAVATRDPSVALIEIFDRCLANAFGENLRRPWPHQHDHGTARKWLDLGVTEAMAYAVLDARMRDMAAKKKLPPKTLSYFDQPMADAVANANRPMPEGNADDDLTRIPAHLDARKNRAAGNFDAAVAAARGILAGG